MEKVKTGIIGCGVMGTNHLKTSLKTALHVLAVAAGREETTGFPSGDAGRSAHQECLGRR